MKKDDKILWKPVSSTEKFETRVFTVYEKKTISPKGENKSFISLKAPNWAIIIPVLKSKDGEDSFIMVEQWRHGAESLFTEFPGGVIDEGETPEEAAKRELLEETGRSASSIKLLSKMSPNPAIMENNCYVFLAEITEEVHSQHLDNDEFLNVKIIPVKTVLKKMGHPPYQHAIMASAAFLYLQAKNSF